MKPTKTGDRCAHHILYGINVECMKVQIYLLAWARQVGVRLVGLERRIVYYFKIFNISYYIIHLQDHKTYFLYIFVSQI